MERPRVGYAGENGLSADTFCTYM